MSIKERLMAIKNKIHSIEVSGETYHYKHLKQSELQEVGAVKSNEFNAAIFCVCLCEEDGSKVFTLEDLGSILDLPTSIVSKVATAAITGDEKKLQGH